MTVQYIQEGDESSMGVGQCWAQLFHTNESGDRMSFTDSLAANVDDWYTCTNGMIQCFNSG